VTPDEPPPPSRRSQEPSFHLQASAGASSHFTTSAATLAGHFVELDAQKEMLQARAGSPGKDGDVRSEVESALLILAYVIQPDYFLYYFAGHLHAVARHVLKHWT
jgi:hypothetical protein